MYYSLDPNANNIICAQLNDSILIVMCTHCYQKKITTHNSNYQVVTNCMILFSRSAEGLNLRCMIYSVYIPTLSAEFRALFIARCAQFVSHPINQQKFCFLQKEENYFVVFQSIALHNYVLMILDHCVHVQVINDNPLMMFEIENRCFFTYLKNEREKKRKKEIQLVNRSICWAAKFCCDVVTDNSNMYKFLSSKMKQMNERWTGNERK